MLFSKFGQLRRRSKILFIGGFIAIAGSLVIMGGLILKERSSLAHEGKIRKDNLRSGRTVQVVAATKAARSVTVELVGEARPYAGVTLYAKISGYIDKINVDKGDAVEAGQTIAIIDSPELNRQHEGALADAINKRLDAQRYKQLLSSGSISQQSADTMDTTAKVAEENAAALKIQKEYEIVRAPFSGVISARYVDPGALVQSATTSQTNALPIVTVSQTDRLRVYVYPDQKTANLVKIGDGVEISDPTRPEVKLSATVTRTSRELDPKTRTMLVEIELDNRAEQILAGSLVQVKLFVRSPETIEIPAQSLIMQKKAAFVGVLSEGNKIVFRAVKVYETDGLKIRLLGGLTEGENVVLNPSEALTDGEKVLPAVSGGDQRTAHNMSATKAVP
jgi:membrane fusion protein, multidrug efflux system